MPTTYSSKLRLSLIAAGEQSSIWGLTTNDNLGTLIEEAIAGAAAVSVTSANQALTANSGTTDEARQAVLVLTTSTGADFAVYAPPQEKLYLVRNDSAYTATVYCSTVLGNTSAAGAGVAIPTGKTMLLRADGTVVYAGPDYFISPTFLTPALGTPSSGVLSSCTSVPVASATGTLAVANGGTGVTSSTGSGANVLGTAPTITSAVLTTPTLTNPAYTSQALTWNVGGNCDWDMDLGSVATVVCGAGDTTMTNPTNMVIGTGIMRVTQDGAGSRLVTAWGSAFKWTAGVEPVLSTAASAVDILSFFCDGTYMYGTLAVRGAAV